MVKQNGMSSSQFLSRSNQLEDQIILSLLRCTQFELISEWMYYFKLWRSLFKKLESLHVIHKRLEYRFMTPLDTCFYLLKLSKFSKVQIMHADLMV